MALEKIMDDLKAPRIVFFDMEGTIFRNIYARVVRDGGGNTAANAWHAIAESLGPEALVKENETKRKWNENEYSGYVEWMEDTIRIHQEYGLKRDIYDKVFSIVEYHNGVLDVFKELKKRGVRTALISGGFKSQADRALKDLKIDHAFVACEYLWDDEGNLVHYNLLPADYEGKVDFMKLIMKEHGVVAQDCAFVGDGRNDIPFAKAVGRSISFNGAKELEEACTYVVRQKEGEENFRGILSYLGIKG